MEKLIKLVHIYTCFSIKILTSHCAGAVEVDDDHADVVLPSVDRNTKAAKVWREPAVDPPVKSTKVKPVARQSGKTAQTAAAASPAASPVTQPPTDSPAVPRTVRRAASRAASAIQKSAVESAVKRSAKGVVKVEVTDTETGVKATRSRKRGR